ncbi:hypothetical protein QR680_000813 [Steinernema hermaphroditum]|uniref:Uncharacterized protein n=1 Tax=Steinernema hermaphroditum TaxID=289476 RepID=A0AA39LEB1_9BILA|nr:hypothetical protein QR680_000813 [Steinernema hermaphroditum]
MDGGRYPRDNNLFNKDNAGANGKPNRKRRRPQDVLIIPPDYYLAPMQMMFPRLMGLRGTAGESIFAPTGRERRTVHSPSVAPPLVRPTPVYGVPVMFGNQGSSSPKCTAPCTCEDGSHKRRYIHHGDTSAFSSPGHSRGSPQIFEFVPIQEDDCEYEPTSNWSDDAVRLASSLMFLKALFLLLNKFKEFEEICQLEKTLKLKN